MAVLVSSDLSVSLAVDANADKLDRQQELKTSIQKRQPRALGVSQVMLGVMMMSYSVPLHYTELTETVNVGAPWWTGLSFLAAGVVVIYMERNCTLKNLTGCLVLTAISGMVAVLAVSLFSMDLSRHPGTPCLRQTNNRCDDRHHATSLSQRLKVCLLFFSVVQMFVSSTVFFLLYKERQAFTQYTYLTENAPATPTVATPPDFN